jgi:hypothetical protein
VWALLLARLYEISPLQCAQCGAPVRMIAFISRRAAITGVKKRRSKPRKPTEKANV